MTGIEWLVLLLLVALATCAIGWFQASNETDRVSTEYHAYVERRELADKAAKELRLGHLPYIFSSSGKVVELYDDSGLNLRILVCESFTSTEVTIQAPPP